MAHHIYTTETFVLESTPRGEANMVFTLFSKDLGLIRATAQGVRLQQSKLKASLQDFSRSRVSLVRGKEVWRITSAALEENLYSIYSDSRQKEIVALIARIFILIKRLVGREEKNEELFRVLTEMLGFIEHKNKELSTEELRLLEYVIVLRVLNNLGYLGTIPALTVFTVSPLNKELLVSMAEQKNLALKEINTSLEHSQL